MKRALGLGSLLVAAACASSCMDEEMPMDDCHGGHCHLVGFDSPEGGEIRVEYVRTPDAELSRGVAFFKADQTPERTPFPDIEPPQEGICNDLAATPMWPTAPVSAKYLDVGDLAITAGGKTIPLTKHTDYTDFLGRTHGVAYSFLDTTTMIAPSTLYDVVIGGSSTTPAQTWSAQLGIPAAFHDLAPAPTASVSIAHDADFAITWEKPAQTIGQRVLGLVAFEDENGAVATLCLTTDTGTGFTVPRAVVAKLPPIGTLVRGHTTHELRQFPDGRRFDVIGTWCYATPYTID